MNKIFLICLCLFIMVGCDKQLDDNYEQNKVDLKYEEMKNKLIEYGKLVYENEQWLNNDSVLIKTHMTLFDLSEKNGYDISMFVNPDTGKQCDLHNSKIEFIILNVDDLENIKYEFNPVLVCDDKYDSTDEDNLNNVELYNKLISYMVDIYDNDEYMNVGLNPQIYRLSLNELEQKGYDISMFVNPDTGKQCNLDNTYGVFEILETTDNGKTDYVFGGVLDCQ